MSDQGRAHSGTARYSDLFRVGNGSRQARDGRPCSTKLCSEPDCCPCREARHAHMQELARDALSV